MSCALASLRPDSPLPLPSSPMLDKNLEDLGILHEKWDIESVNLEGVNLKAPHDELIRQIVKGNKLCLMTIEVIRAPNGYVDIVDFSKKTPNLDKVKHYHSSPETRLILDGEATLHIYLEGGKTHEILLTKGSYYFLPKGIEHKFTASKQTTVLRIFSNLNGWTAQVKSV